jgi:hypothetical protein
MFLLTCSTQTLAQTGNPVGSREVSPLQNLIESRLNFITENQRFVSQLTAADLIDLPVGIARKIGDKTVVIAIDSAYFDRGNWHFSAYTSIPMPGTGRNIAFMGKGFMLNKGGVLLSSDTRLILASPIVIPLSDFTTLTLPADGRNFIKFDCNGFKSFNLKGLFSLSKAYFVPDPLMARGDTAVTATFEVGGENPGNFLIQTSITPFKLNGVNEFSFRVTQATADLSDFENPPGFSFPQQYQQTFGDNLNLWRGFFLKQVEVRYMGMDSTGKNASTFQGQNILIDEQGISGLFSGENIISLEQGSIAGWNVSVEKISLQLMLNQLTGGGIEGKIIVPFIGKEPMGYGASFFVNEDGQLDYNASVTINTEKGFKMAFGEIKLNKGCKLGFGKNRGKLVASALLNGNITLGGDKVQATGIRFEQLGLSTVSPYVHSGIFSMGTGQARTGGFPVRLDSLRIGIAEGEVVLGIGVALNFMTPEDKGFSARTFVSLHVKQEVETQTVGEAVVSRQTWKLSKVKVHDILLRANTNAFTLNGRLVLFDKDPTYGDGFMGSIAFSISKILEKGIQVNAYFGSKFENGQDFRYWHVDAYLPTKNIPIVPPLAMSGIIGGASYRMIRPSPFQPDFNKLNKSTTNTPPATPTSSNSNTTPTVADSLMDKGIAQQFTYVPDANAGLSFMAGVTLICGNEKAVNSDVVLEVAFGSTGGIRQVRFNGGSYFFTAIESRPRSSGGSTVVTSAPIYASMNMLFDNDNDVFHANINTYMDVAGVIRGVGPGGMIGNTVIHIDPKDWYIYIGRPSQRLGVEIIKLARGEAYFITGSKLEDLPLPPARLREAFNMRDVSLSRNELQAQKGIGFAMGAAISIGVNAEAGPVYASVNLEAGADVMLLNLGNSECAGRPGKGIGIGGWYAIGQAYACLEAAVGLRFKRKRFDILKAFVGALLQAKLPNPTWIKGGLRGEYRILGGLVKGKFTLDFQVGEECQIIRKGNELDDIQVIGDISPDENAQQVSVFATPQVSFNVLIGQEISIPNQQQQTNTYKVVLDEFALLDGNSPVIGTQQWSSGRDVLVLKSTEILPPQKQLKVRVKLHWEKKQSNGGWEVMKENGQTDYEVKEHVFTTGPAPDNIPSENVAYTYPLQNQYNFHPAEYNKGYVQLDRGQKYLFESSDPSGSSWRFVARFASVGRPVIEANLSYNEGERAAEYDIPAGLEGNKVYKLTLVKVPQTTADISSNVSRSDKKIETGVDSVEVNVASSQVTSTLTGSGEKELYQIQFRASQYATFAAKIEGIQKNGNDLFDIAVGNIYVIGKKSFMEEDFDEYEIAGASRVSPLVSLSASLETPWLKDRIYPHLYELYPPASDVSLNWRVTTDLGIVPVKNVRLSKETGLGNYKLTEAQASSGQLPSRSGEIVVGYYLSTTTFKDYDELRNNAMGNYLKIYEAGGVVPEGIRRLYATKYSDIWSGKYPVDISYRLPGKNQVTTTTQIQIEFK